MMRAAKDRNRKQLQLAAYDLHRYPMFISEDPIGLAGGINMYTYAGNDPINSSDPMGLQPDCPDSNPCYSGPPIVVTVSQASDFDLRNLLAAFAERTANNIGEIASGAWTALNRNTCQPPRCQSAVIANVTPGGMFTRFGRGAEKAADLARQAALAEGKLGVHGVSVMKGTLTRTPGAHATGSALESAGFPLVQTGRPGHYTAMLPKPVTEAVARAWNSVWGWRQK